MKIFSGKVVSTKMDKTATVAVERLMAHPVYKKRLKRTRKYHVHDELGARVGERVNFVACKPVSKNKKWKVIEVISDKGKVKSKKSRKETAPSTHKKTQAGKKS